MTSSNSTRADLPFWLSLDFHGDAVALVDKSSHAQISYRDLYSQVRSTAEQLHAPTRRLILLCAKNEIDCIVCYLSILFSGNVVYLVAATINHPSTTALIEQYRPDVLLWHSGTPDDSVWREYTLTGNIRGYNMLARRVVIDAPPPADLALVLSTSASTGNPKSVRLSARSVTLSAMQVADALRITSHERALLTLPIAHVYGLSVLNSHLYAGGSVVVGEGSVAHPEFWKTAAHFQPTSLAGVSYTFDYIRMQRLERAVIPSLRRLTHSGDRLPKETFHWIYEEFGRRELDLYLMYGQTEACGRMTVLLPEFLPERSDSVGRALRLSHVHISPPGEIVYRGPGVMLGYAQCRSDLNLGDCLSGTLHTGDLGHIDKQGFLYIAGRINRFCKIFGQRLNLDEVEDFFRDFQPIAVVATERTIVIFSENPRPQVHARVLDLARQSRLPAQLFQLRYISTLPRNAAGKIAYPLLALQA